MNVTVTSYDIGGRSTYGRTWDLGDMTTVPRIGEQIDLTDGDDDLILVVYGVMWRPGKGTVQVFVR